MEFSPDPAFELIPGREVDYVRVGPDGRKIPDPITVGSLESQARGAGARKSAGKPELWQFPWWVLGAAEFPITDLLPVEHSREWYARACFGALSEWQRGHNDSLNVALAFAAYGLAETSGERVLTVRSFIPVVRVLEFGARKYAPGNWAKGMSWNVCFTSAMSHLTKILAGEDIDEESGLKHEAHLICNLVFLLGYRDLYPEGDDRLPMFRHGGVKP